MILSKAPFRVSFFGGGTDYPLYYMENGGSVVSTAIDKYLCIVLRKSAPYSKHKYILKYSRIESVNNLEEIQHPAIREVLKYFEIDFGVELHVVADLPARSGLGSSSTFTVALIAAVVKLMGQSMTPDDVARLAIKIEQTLIDDKVGSQDQVAAAIGGFNKIEFMRGGSIRHTPIYLPTDVRRKLFGSMRLLYTNIQRSSSSVTTKQLQNTQNGSLDSYLRDLKSLTEAAYNDLLNSNISQFGSRLDQAWELKKHFTDNVTNTVIDDLYQKGLDHGAIGGKLLGAGNGGFLLFYVDDDQEENFDSAFSNEIVLKIKPSSTGVETKVIDA